MTHVSSHIEEDDDPVIATFDVFNVSSLAGSLHLFQYPLRAAFRPYEASSISMAVTSGCVVDVASGAATASSDGANNNSGGTAPSSTGTTPSAATAGGSSSSSSVVQPFSRVLLSCEFDTFNHAESFSKPSNVNASSAAGASPYRSQQRSSTSRMSALMGGSSDGEAKDEFSMDDFNDYHQQQQQQHGASSSSHRYRYSLRSEPFIPRSEYAVGVFRDGALHLTTVASVQQFTPVISSSASAVNSARMAAKQQQRSNSGNSNVAAFGGVPNIPEFCSGLLVEEDHCSRKPSDENHTNGGNNGGSGGGLQAIGPIADMIQRQLRRQRSFAINTDATATKVVEYFRSNTVESGVISRRLSGSTTSSSSSSNTRGDTAYHKLYSSNPVLAMKTIFPMERIVDHGATLQREFLLKHSADVSISNQIRDLIQSSQVMSLSSLLRLLVPPTATTPISIDAVLEALRGSAFFMHGVWVAKSNERVFRGNSAAMREVILLKFWQSPDGTVRREELNSLVVNRGSAMVAIIKSILESVSTLLTSSTPENRRWVLKEMSEDAQVREELCRTFSEQHPNEYQFQQAAWTKRVQQILSHIPVLDSGKFVRGLAMAATAAAATSGSNGSSLMASPIRNRNSTGGGGSAGGNGGAVATLSTSSAPLSGDAADAAIGRVRNFTRRLFLEHGVINKQRAKELISKARPEQFPEATNVMLSTGVQLEVHQFTASTWVLKHLLEQETDLYRPFLLSAVIELDNFESRVAVQRAAELYQKHLEAQPGGVAAAGADVVATIPQRVVQRVLSEVAVYRSAERLWHVKSGNILQQ